MSLVGKRKYVQRQPLARSVRWCPDERISTAYHRAYKHPKGQKSTHTLAHTPEAVNHESSTQKESCKMLASLASDDRSPIQHCYLSLCVTQVYGNRKRVARTGVTKWLLILLGIS